MQPAGAVSWGSRILCSEVIPQTSAAGSNYARTTQCLAVFGQSNGQHKPLYSSLCVRHKGQGDALTPPSFVISMRKSQEPRLPFTENVLSVMPGLRDALWSSWPPPGRICFHPLSVCRFVCLLVNRPKNKLKFGLDPIRRADPGEGFSYFL